MKINNITWSTEDIEIIYSLIMDISDIEDQKKVWRGDYAPDRVGSYIEYRSRLFDDCFFNNFIDDYLNIVELPQEFKEKTKLLREKLNLFDGYVIRHKEIFNHPKWVEISDIAKEVIELWKNSGLPH